MRSKEYWARRASERMVGYQADAIKTANEIGRAYFAAQKYLEAEAAKVFRGFQNGFKLSEADARRYLENVPDENALKTLRKAVLKMPDGEEKQAALAMLSSPAYQYRINRLDALNRNIVKTCGELCGVELKADKAFLGETARKAYLETVFDIQKGTGVSGAFDMIPDGTVDQILKRNWSGANYSERIWGNTQKMADELKSDLLAGVLTGKTEREIADVIAARYQTSQFNARRLVQTETTYVVGQAELQAFKEAGAEKYEFSALLDAATSAICRGLDGKKFPVSEARPGENYPPMHPFCRSVTVADLPSEEELDKRWNDSADELGLDLPFDEWAKHLQTAPDGKMRYVKDLGETLDKSGQSGIIKVGSGNLEQAKTRDKKIVITDIAVSKVSPPIISNFSDEQNAKFQELHKELLRVAKEENDSNEVAFLFNPSTLEYEKELGGLSRVNIFLNPIARDMYRNSSKSELYLLHNHPSTKTFSYSDLGVLLLNENLGGITVVTNAGHTEVLRKTENYDFDTAYRFLKEIRSEYKGKVLTETQDAEIARRFIKAGKKYGITIL